MLEPFPTRTLHPPVSIMMRTSAATRGPASCGSSVPSVRGPSANVWMVMGPAAAGGAGRGCAGRPTLQPPVPPMLLLHYRRTGGAGPSWL